MTQLEQGPIHLKVSGLIPGPSVHRRQLMDVSLPHQCFSLSSPLSKTNEKMPSCEAWMNEWVQNSGTIATPKKLSQGNPNSLFFLKPYFLFSFEREGKGEGKERTRETKKHQRERKTLINCLLHVPQLEIKSEPWVCMCPDWELNQWLFSE